MKKFTEIRGRLLRPQMRRRYLTMSDQAASSLSNVLIFILVARSFDSVEAVGAFSAAMIGYQLVLGSTRSFVGKLFLSLYSHVSPRSRDELTDDLLGATIFIASVAATSVAAVALVLGGMLGSALLALALVLPAVLLQDTWRFAFVVDRPGAALTVDLVWLAVVVAAFPFRPDGMAVGGYIVLWGVGGGLGAVAGWILSRHRPRQVRPLRWLLENRADGLRFFGEFGTARAANHVVTSGLGLLVGLGALGAVRASQTYYGPHNTLHGGIYLAVVPEGAQLRDQPHRLQRMLMIVSVGLAIVAGLWMVAGLVLPDSLGRSLLGVTWEDARPLLLPMGLGTMASAVMSGGLLGLRSLADTRRSLRARLRSTPFEVACPLIGAVMGGAVGFAVGFAAARVASAVIWWMALRQALTDIPRRDEPVPEPDDETATLAAAREEALT